MSSIRASTVSRAEAYCDCAKNHSLAPRWIRLWGVSTREALRWENDMNGTNGRIKHNTANFLRCCCWTTTTSSPLSQCLENADWVCEWNIVDKLASTMFARSQIEGANILFRYRSAVAVHSFASSFSYSCRVLFYHIQRKLVQLTLFARGSKKEADYSVAW